MICSCASYQPAYQNLKEYYEYLKNYIKDESGKVVKTFHFFDADETIKDPSELDRNENHIMILDDVILKDQTQIKDDFAEKA